MKILTSNLLKYFKNKKLSNLSFLFSNVKQNGTQANNPIRIPFQQENKYQILQICSMNVDKKTLQKHHQQFMINLINDNNQAKLQFEEIQESVKNLYGLITTDILKEEGFAFDSQFIKRSHYYFQSEGKKIRPIMVNMLASCFGKNDPIINKNIQTWSALIEMMHISSLAHDDIIDDSPSRRGVQSQHLKYGIRSAVFSANFIIAKASRAIYNFNNLKLFQIYSVAMENLATGEIIQAATKNIINQNQKLLIQQIQTYLHKSYYKTAALMANALRAVPIFYPNTTLEQETACFRIGQHFGIAFQLIDDILDYTSTSEQMGKENLADIIEGNVTGPVFFSVLSESKHGKTSKYMLNELRSKNKTKQEAQQIKQWVFKNQGIELTFALADQHIKKGLQYLTVLPNANHHVWRYLGYKIIARSK